MVEGNKKVQVLCTLYSIDEKIEEPYEDLHRAIPQCCGVRMRTPLSWYYLSHSKKYFPRHVNPKWALLGRRLWPGQSVHSGHWWTLNVVAGSGSPVKEFSQKFSFFLHFLFFITNKQFGFSKDPLTFSNDDFCGQTFQLSVKTQVGAFNKEAMRP